MKRRYGFTLVELLAVIVVIALISLLAMPPLVNQLSKTKEDSKNAGFELIYLAASQYLEDNKNLNRELCSNINNCSPDVYCVTLGSMVNDGKLKAPIKNTVTGAQYKLTDAVRVSYYGPGKYRYEFVTDGSCSTVPTYIVDKAGWSVTKNITINYPKLSGTVTKDYSTDGGNSWHTYNNPVAFNSNGTIIGRISNESKQIKGDKLTINKIDSTPPTLSEVSIVNSVGELVVKATGKDPESEVIKYQYSSDDGQNWSSVTSKDTYTFSNLALNKDYKVKVRVINSTYLEESKFGSGLIAGKNYLDSATKDVRLTDVSEPTYLLTPKNGWSKSKTVKILYPKGYINEYSLNNGSTWNLYEKDLVFNDNGTIIARAKDDNNNVILGQKLQINTIDNTAPTSVDFTTTETTSKITINATATDNESGIYGYQYSKDGGNSWTDVTTSNTYTFTDLGTGSYEIRVRAINGTYENDGLSDNYCDSSVKTVTTKSLIEPTYTIEPDNVWSQTKRITIDYHFTDSDYNYEYSLDDGKSWHRYTTPFTIDHPTTIIARVSDGTNYLVGSAQTITKIDLTKPDSIKPEFDTTSRSITINVSAIDNESGIYGYQFSIDNGETWTSIQSEGEYTYNNLNAGYYDVKVRAINNTYIYDGLNNKSYIESETESISTIEIGSITYEIKPEGWSFSKEVNIYYPEGYTNQYSIDGGETWQTYDENEPIVVDHNLTILSRVTDGHNYVYGETKTISTIDLTKPDYVDFSYTIDNGTITAIADAADNNSGIYGYQFSLDDGETWTEIKTSNVYTFTKEDMDTSEDEDSDSLDENSEFYVKVRAINNTYENEDIDEEESKNYLDSESKRVKLKDYTVPTFDIEPKGWSTKKIITFDEDDTRESDYSIDGGQTWKSTICDGDESCAEGVVIDSCPKEGCKIIVRAKLDGSYLTSNTYTITTVDNTAPKGLTIDHIVKGNSIVVTAGARDDESGIYGYQFSDDGETWTDIQTSPTYTFTDLDSDTYTIYARVINNTYENEKEMADGDEESALNNNYAEGSIEVTVETSASDDIGKTYEYGYANKEQVFETPAYGYYKIEAWGAQGGATKTNVDGTGNTVEGGKGAYTSGIVKLNSGDQLYLNVGAKGIDGRKSTTAPASFNGGGTGGSGYQGGGAGGGASDVRLISKAENDSKSLASRIMVAAGGGGASNYYNPVSGGYGGTLIGDGGKLNSNSVSHTLAGGGTQTAGGNAANESNPGSFGYGGNSQSGHGGGGGAGYYGGGGGGVISSGVSSAAGGSSYISGYKGSVAITSETNLTPKLGCDNGTNDVDCSYHYSGIKFNQPIMKAGNQSMPATSGSSTTVGHSGDGKINITYLGENPEFNYDSVNDYQTFISDENSRYKVELWGAAGGSSIADGGNRAIEREMQTVGHAPAGKGAYTTGVISLNKNDKLHLYVGGKGEDAKVKTKSAGGYNGGGLGNDDESDDESDGAGGGATDVRLTPGIWYDKNSLGSRIMVAAGGGGAHDTLRGRNGGALTSESTDYVKGATQTRGNAFGIGQDGSLVSANLPSAGGGGGYFGGYSGKTSVFENVGTGGSSYISGYHGAIAVRSATSIIPKAGCSAGVLKSSCSYHYSNYVFTATDMKSGSDNMPTYTGTSTMSGNNSGGHVKITLLGDVTTDDETDEGDEGDETEIIEDSNVSSYAYTGSEEVFTAKKSGKYRIEAWGAQGGNRHDVAGGTGGYSTGYVTLTEGSKLYINVGGKGKSTTQEQNDLTAKPGGYNGGGTSGNGSVAKTDGVKWSAGAGGGGATHVATTSGLLSSLSSNRSSILIVAGGGGGASKHSTPGSGGGFKGGSATSYGGATIQGGTQTTGYAFGQGQSITNQKSGGSYGAEGNGGAGGGFYGGSVHNVTGDNSDAGGAGGSGYIGNSSLTTKHMTCNDCEESGSDSTKTVSTPNKSEAPVSNYPKLGDGYVKITYVEEETDTTPDQEAEYDYTGGQQTFTAAKNGYYKIEAWGASGGDYLNFNGGVGSYSSGYVNLTEGSKLYINVGGQGKSTTQEKNDLAGKAGGYNGGGKSGDGSNGWSAGASGGGATHVATTSGLLSSLSSNRSSILIVAGGGGGASKHSTAGNAGGFTGGSATSYGGATIQGGTQTTGYAFGQGQSITNQKSGGGYGSEGNGGAGGGFFGGYAHNVTGDNSDAGGAGGSGYIGNTNLVNKYMACYSCSTSNAEDTKTISSNRVSDRPITSYAKRGNGYVRIIYIGEELNEPGETVTGPTKVDAQAGETHKGIVYLDPTDLTKECNKSNSVSTTETKTGCMKWYIFDDSGDNYKMILDHNTTAGDIKWNDSNKNVAYESSNLKPVVDDLVATSKWKVTPRLITANEISTITGKTGFDASNTSSRYYFDTLTTTSPTFSDSVRSKYDWLYNNSFECKTDDIDYGCTIEDNELHSSTLTFGYWTSTPVGTAGSGSWMWMVRRYGELDYTSSDSVYSGIRPVISVSKSKIS